MMSNSNEPAGVTLNQIAAETQGDPDVMDSLTRLVEMAAHSDTGGASVAAQLLLGLYDGAEHPFDLTELCRLDSDLISDALCVIEFRVRERIEPHEFFVDGGKLFQQIAGKWHLQPKSAQRHEVES